MPPRQGRDKPVRPGDMAYYDTVHQGFRWRVPQRFNMAEVCARRWAADPQHADQTAVIY